jgi:hypothetical protein
MLNAIFWGLVAGAFFGSGVGLAVFIVVLITQ